MKEFFKQVIKHFGDINQFWRQLSNHSNFNKIIVLCVFRIITDYNRHMGGVDNFDKYISYY